MIAAIISLRYSRHARLDTTTNKRDRTARGVCVRANSSIYIGKVASTKASAGAAARSEEKIEEECTLYYMVNFIIGTRASAVTTTGRIIARRLA